jgi:hypothetical protein
MPCWGIDAYVTRAVSKSSGKTHQILPVLTEKKPDLAAGLESAVTWCSLDIQVLHIQRVLFDELAA